MGRKRTSNKKNMMLSIDKDLIKRLKELEVNRSLLFTEAAEKLLSELDEKSNKKE